MKFNFEFLIFYSLLTMVKSNILSNSDTLETDKFSVEILDSQKCPRYTARIIRGVSVVDSPDWFKQRLLNLGQRPVNAVVDVTNYILLECGQPLHAFDLKQIRGNKIIVKTAADGEKFTTLDDKERLLDSSMLMICDAERAVAIGGVMGGQNSEINAATTDILLESAYFEPASVRRTSKKLALQSESSYRFERGVDFANVDYASARAAKLIAEFTGGTIDPGFIDIYPRKIEPKQVTLRYKRANDIIGIDISNAQIDELLAALKFKTIAAGDDSVTVEVPTYRVDISLEIDLIEEIARLYNYDNIQPDFAVSIDSSGKDSLGILQAPKLRYEIRRYLVGNGFNEILTQNMIDPKSAEIFTDKPVVIANPLGEELSVLRPSLSVSMLKTIERNIRLGNKSLKLFEIGKSFHNALNSGYDFIEGVYEKEELLIAITGNTQPMQWGAADREADYFDIKGILNNFISYFKVLRLQIAPVTAANEVFSVNCSEIKYKGDTIGYAGEINSDMLKKFGLQQRVLAVSLDLHKLYRAERKKWKYTPVTPYPVVTRDLAFLVADNIPAEDMSSEINASGGNLIKNITVFDVYKGKNMEPGKKSLAFSISYSSNERTLTDTEVEESIKNITKSIETKFGAELRKM